MSSRFVLKKLFKMATVLGLVTAAHLAYVQAFDHLVARLRADHGSERLVFPVRESDNKRMVKEIATRAFGPDHWTGSDDLMRYVLPEKNLVLFTMDLKRPIEANGVKFEGKRIELAPFAMTLGSPGEGSVRTLTSKTAVIDLNKPFGINPKTDNTPLAIRKMVLENEVMIRDDRGTPEDPADDLCIGPINQVEYIDDGVAPVIKSEYEIVLVDRGLRVTGVGLEIHMRPRLAAAPGQTGGFDGAQKVILKHDVRTTMLDAGSSGLTGGPNAPKKTAKAKDADAVPLDVRCQGPLVIDLPRRPDAPVVGPPEPARPTLVEYRNLVVVRRGKLTEIPDQIDCDTLFLTLFPSEEASKAEPQADAAQPAAGSTAKKESPGAFGGLALRRIMASGHTVWVQSPTQGVKIRCVELLHYKDAAAGKSTTVFNGGGPKKLWVEKRDIVAEGPEKGKVQSITHIWCNDATLIDDGDMARATLVANGPGELESRPGLGAALDAAVRDIPPSRTAVWRDQLWLQNETPVAGREPGRILVLKGNPRVEDRDQKSSLEAAETIAVWLRPDEKKKAQTTIDGREVVPTAFVQPAADAGSDQKPSLPPIRKLVAVKNVHLVDPSRDMRLRDKLQVNFETGEVSTAPGRNPNPLAKAPASSRSAAVEKSTAPASAAADAQAVPDLTPVPDQEKGAAVEKPAAPKMIARALSAEALVIVSPAAKTEPATTATTTTATAAKPEDSSSYELRELMMFDEVRLDQEPAPGKKVGTHAEGEVLVVHNEAKGRLVFDLYHHNPHSDKGRRIAPEKTPKARVQTDETLIIADIIGVDQAADQAWARGAGTYSQLTDRGVLTDRPAEEVARDQENADPARPKRGGKTQTDKVTLTVTWKGMMTFEGVSRDLRDQPAAKITFLKGVHALMEDGLLHGEESMTIYTDKPIPLAEVGKLTGKQAKTEAGANAETDAAKPEPRADLSMLQLVGTQAIPATAISRKVHPLRPVLMSQQRMEAHTLIYDRRSGAFHAPGPGQVFLYDRQAKSDQAAAPDFGSAVAVRPTSYRPGEDDETDVEPAPRSRTGTGTKERIAASPDVRRAVGSGAGAKPTKPLDPPLVLTQIQFQGKMIGRFGSGKQDDVDTQRWAEFFGAVETARGEIPEPVGNQPLTQFRFDHLPPEATFLTSDKLRVINEPPPVGSEKTANGRNFLKAWDNAYVNARDTALQADVITYDSLNDLVVANGLEGRPVRVVQQAAVGQPTSPMRAEVIKFNPRSGSLDVGGPETMRFYDLKTSARPTVQKPYDPDAKAPKKPTPPKPMRVNPIERRGFSGQ